MSSVSIRGFSFVIMCGIGVGVGAIAGLLHTDRSGFTAWALFLYTCIGLASSIAASLALWGAARFLRISINTVGLQVLLSAICAIAAFGASFWLLVVVSAVDPWTLSISLGALLGGYSLFLLQRAKQHRGHRLME